MSIHTLSRSFIFISLFIFFFSCNNAKYDKEIYKIGRLWEYKVFSYDMNGIMKDSCKIIMEIRKINFISFLSGQKNLTYKYINCCNGDLNNIEESTGVEEDSTQVFIHPPRLGCFAFTEITPMPAISFPINIESTKEISLNVNKSTFQELSGKTILQTQKFEGKEQFNFKNNHLEVYSIVGENSNYIEEFGKYKSKFLFDPNMGFVFMKFIKPNGESVELILHNTNF